MLAKQVIFKALTEIFDDRDVRAGQIYKGYDYNSARDGNGWWYKSFQGNRHIFLGESLEKALKTIGDMKEEKI